MKREEKKIEEAVRNGRKKLKVRGDSKKKG